MSNNEQQPEASRHVSIQRASKRRSSDASNNSQPSTKRRCLTSLREQGALNTITEAVSGLQISSKTMPPPSKRPMRNPQRSGRKLGPESLRKKLAVGTTSLQSHPTSSSITPLRSNSSLSTSPKRTPKHLQDLPGEMILSVADHLSTGEAMLFSLTCRKIYDIVKTPDLVTRLSRETGRADRLAFLRLLEKDHKDLLLCSIHEKLHVRCAEEEKDPLNFGLLLSRRACTKVQSTVNLADRYVSHRAALVLSRPVLELVLRHDILGAQFGIPPQSLRKSLAINVLTETATVLKVETDARTIRVAQDTHLLVQTQFTMEFDIEQDSTAIWRASGMAACEHQGRKIPQALETSLRAVVDQSLLHFESLVHSCAHCPTDMQAVIQRPSTKWLFPTVTFTAWRDMGPRGRHTDLIWRSQGSCVVKMGRQGYALMPGVLKDMWESAKPSEQT